MAEPHHPKDEGSAGQPRTPARSWLFIPADRPRFLAKLPGITADAVVLDLEDGAGGDSHVARGHVAAWVGNAAAPVPPALYVRTREVDHHGFDADVKAAMGSRLAGLVLPKVASAGQVRHAAAVSAELATGFGGAAAPTLVLIIESAAGLASLPSILDASDRIAAVAFGAEDFAADLGLPPALGGGEPRPSEGILNHARARIAVACAAAGVDLRIDTPSLDLNDETSLIRDVLNALTYGFTAKFLIHPAQIDHLHRTLKPSQAAIGWATTVIGAAPDGAGALRVDGRMVDEAILKQARKVLGRARPDD